jgi:hypothetical protein
MAYQFYRLARRSIRQGAWPHRALAQPALRRFYRDTAALKPRSKRDDFQQWQKACGFSGLATMNRKAPLPNLRSQKPTWREAAALAREWELQQLAGRPA